MSTTNLLILFCVRIKVKRVKRSQFDAVRTMLERCVIRKVIVQSFHSRDNIFSNSHNRSTKKINDMSMSVRDEKILLVKKITQMKSLQFYLLFPTVIEVGDALIGPGGDRLGASIRHRPPRSLRHPPRIPTRRARARYFL